ncbi:MAG: tetratricopeptide repeat protein [Promethearchaeota archaeon]
MLQIFLSSTYRDLAEYRSKILNKLNSAFKGVGMEDFVPDGSDSQEVCIRNLKNIKESGIVVFLISPYYGSLIESCSLKEECRAECPMKKGTGKISFTHCEYKNALAEGIMHQTYIVGKGWDASDVKKEALEFKDEIGKEYLGFIDIEDPNLVQLICNNLATKIIEWHTQDKLDFTEFVDREKVLNDIMKSIDGKIEVWGIGGVGKTALIQVALLVQKLKGRKILSIGTSKSYASGSGFEDFRTKCKKEQYVVDSQNEITIYDVINAFEENELLSNAKELREMSTNKKIEALSNVIRNEENLILFIDDFHLATEDVIKMAKSVDHLILSSRKNTYVASKEIYISGIDDKDRENLINLFSKDIPENVKQIINKIAEGHPVSTELLVKNYHNINFDKIKEFDLTDANDNQVKDFYQRVIEEIFSDNPQALTLLKNLAVLNSDIATNINRESVILSYDFESVRKAFIVLVDTGMLKKKEGKEGTYEFYFKHIQDYLEDKAIEENHEKAIEYYENKKSVLGEDIDDAVEVLFHRLKAKHSQKMLNNQFNEIKSKLHPTYYGFKRLIVVGEELKNLLDNKEKPGFLYILGLLYDRLKRYGDTEQSYLDALKIIRNYEPNEFDSSVHQLLGLILLELGSLYVSLNRFKKAEEIYLQSYQLFKELKFEIWAQKDDEKILVSDLGLETTASSLRALGDIYFQTNRIEESVQAYSESLNIFKKLVEKCGPQAYTSQIADTYIKLGQVYEFAGEVKKAENEYLEALDIYIEEAKEDPEDLDDVAYVRALLGFIYAKTERKEEAERSLLEALNIRKNLVARFQDRYLPQLAGTHHDLGNFYNNSGRFEEAEFAYNEALKIRQDLAERSPETYLLDLSETHNNLGILYTNLGKIEEAEQSYLKAIRIEQDLVEKYHEAYSPQLAKTLDNLGDFYVDLERSEKAEEAYKEALKIRKSLMEQNPEIYLTSWEETHNKLINYYFKLGKLEVGKKILNDSLDLVSELAAQSPKTFNKTVVKIRLSLGTIMYNMKKFKDAIEQFDKALEIDPECIDAWVNKGAAYAMLEKYDKAIECYDKSLEIDMDLSIGWYNKACLESLRNNKENSIKYLKKAISLEKTCINDAITEEDFENIRDSNEFKEIIGELKKGKPKQKFCTNCGTKIKKGNKFCTNCGKKLYG